MVVDELRRFATRIFQCFLESALETQFVILASGDSVDEFVQFKLNNRILYGEVLRPTELVRAPSASPAADARTTPAEPSAMTGVSWVQALPRRDRHAKVIPNLRDRC